MTSDDLELGPILSRVAVPNLRMTDAGPMTIATGQPHGVEDRTAPGGGGRGQTLTLEEHMEYMRLMDGDGKDDEGPCM